MIDMILDIRPKAFLFDLDGTLIDSEMLWAHAMVSWLADYGIRTDVKDIARIVFGHSWQDIRTALIGRYPPIRGGSLPQHTMELHRHYDRVSKGSEPPVIATSVDFFRRAAEIAPCAIVSGSPHGDVENAARLCGIDGITAFMLGGEDYENGKPAPDGYLAAARRFNVEPCRCIVIEDSTAGVRSGLAAGMNVIGLDRNVAVPQDFTGCLATVHDLSLLLRR